MLSRGFNRMHRHTRSAQYADRKGMQRDVRANRPGAHGFSFTGDFPEAEDWQPVEAATHRRRYSEPSGNTGAYRVVDDAVTDRLPVVNRYGIRLGPALVLLVVLASLLGSITVMAYSGNSSVTKRLAEQEERMIVLNNEVGLIQGEISYRSNGVNVRQEASRIGLVSSKDVAVEYISVPANAVYGLGTAVGAQDMASIWGQ